MLGVRGGPASCGRSTMGWGPCITVTMASRGAELITAVSHRLSPSLSLSLIFPPLPPYLLLSLCLSLCLLLSLFLPPALCLSVSLPPSLFPSLSPSPTLSLSLSLHYLSVGVPVLDLMGRSERWAVPKLWLMGGLRPVRRSHRIKITYSMEHFFH